MSNEKDFLQTNHRGVTLFDQEPKTKDKIRRFSERKAGFGKTDRFLYKKLAFDLQACDEHLSPANYNHADQYRKLTQLPCNTVIVRNS